MVCEFIRFLSNSTAQHTTPHHQDSQRSLRCCSDPRHRISPSTMIPIREQSADASSIECVVSTIVESCRTAHTREMTSHMYLLAAGSIPALGSSRKITGGSPIIAMATQSLRLFPPLRLNACLCSNSPRSSCAILDATQRSRLSGVASAPPLMAEAGSGVCGNEMRREERRDVVETQNTYRRRVQGAPSL